MRVTVDLDPKLHRAVKAQAARSGRSVRAILEEAIEAWLVAAEEREDRVASAAALAGYERSGGTSVDAFFGTLGEEIKRA